MAPLWGSFKKWQTYKQAVIYENLPKIGPGFSDFPLFQIACLF